MITNINTIYSMFKYIVKKYPNKKAIIENNRTLTFSELSTLTDIIASSFPKKITIIKEI